MSDTTKAPIGMPPAKPKKLKRQSRAARWAAACSAALQGLEALSELRQEYEDWQGNLPDNLQGSALGEKLGAVVDLDIESALETVKEAEGLDLPQGFGRD